MTTKNIHSPLGKNLRMAIYVVVGIVGGVSVALGVIDSDQFSGWLASIPGVLSILAGIVAGSHIEKDPEPDTEAVESLDHLRDSLGVND